MLRARICPLHELSALEDVLKRGCGGGLKEEGIFMEVKLVVLGPIEKVEVDESLWPLAVSD